MTHRRRAYTRVERVAMKGATCTPWNGHCHVCCCQMEGDDNTREPGAPLLVRACSWWFATEPEAREYVLAHLASHVEVP